MEVSKTAIKSVGDAIFCDFAGQPYFHKTHGLFFSESTTVFLLVVDLTKSNSELQESSFYLCAFVKCSVGLTELKKAFLIVIGSRKDELQNLENGEMKLRELVVNLRQTYGRWFSVHAKSFVLNCRERSSKTLELLKQAIREVKTLVIEVITFLNVGRFLNSFSLIKKISKDVPLIVEAAVTSFLPTLRDPFYRLRPSVKERIFAYFSENEKTKEIREKTLSNLRKRSLIPKSEKASHITTTGIHLLLIYCYRIVVITFAL